MFQVTDKTVSKVGDGFVGPNAHVVAIAADTHRAYFPLKDAGGKTVLRVFKVAGSSGAPDFGQPHRPVYGVHRAAQVEHVDRDAGNLCAQPAKVPNRQ
ncbi:hypothetical protein AWB81_06270 [Caballeronia arationis]|nr:hypothetical protein AWB81_06270 [Caballeronia arationis]